MAWEGVSEPLVWGSVLEPACLNMWAMLTALASFFATGGWVRDNDSHGQQPARSLSLSLSLDVCWGD